MKKFLLAILVVAVTFSMAFAAAKTELPVFNPKTGNANVRGYTLLNEGFEYGIPANWTIYDFDGDGYEWSAYLLGVGTAHTDSVAAGIHWNGSGNNDWLITPRLVCSSSTPDTLKFWYRSNSSYFPEDFNVRVSTSSDVSDTSSYAIVNSVTSAPDTWTEMVVPLDSYDGNKVYVAIQCVSVDEYYLFVDDVTGPIIAPEAGDIIINEINPKTGGEYVELYNTKDVDISLDSVHLAVFSGGFDTLLTGDTIPANGYFTVDFPSNHLDNSGDTVAVGIIEGADTTLFDMVAYGDEGPAPVSPNGLYLSRCSYTVNWNGSQAEVWSEMANDWNMTANSTPGAANSVKGTALGSGVVINEIDPYPPSGNDLVEIYNPTSDTVNLSGYYLSDGDAFAEIVTSPVVPPQGWVVLEENVDWTTSMDFSSSDVAYLFAPDSTRIDQIGWAGDYNDYTYQRYPDGAGPHYGFDWASSGGGVTWFDVYETWGKSNWTIDTTYNITGIVNLSDNPGDLSGTIVTLVTHTNTYLDTTDATGAYTFNSIPCDTVNLAFEHTSGYYTKTRTDVVTSDTSFTDTLLAYGYITGIVGLSDNPADSSGSIVSIIMPDSTVYTDTTDVHGAFSILNPISSPADTETVVGTISHPGYYGGDSTFALTYGDYDFGTISLEAIPPAPTNLTAESDWDGMVPLHWEPAINGTLLSYVDGTPDSYFGYGSPGNGFAVKFTPTSYPVVLNLARLLPNNDNPYMFYVWDDDGTGGAPFTVIDSHYVEKVFPGQWNYVNLNISIDSGSFYIGYIETNDGTNYFGRDTLNLDNTSWVFSGGSWESLTTAFGGAYNCDFYFEAVVNTGGTKTILSPKKPIIKRGLKSASIPDAKPYTPKFKYNLKNRATLNYFNIYRDTTTINDISALTPIDTISNNYYTDTTVTNGITYHYVVTGMYDTGESDPSNEAVATPKALVTSGDYMIVDMADTSLQYNGNTAAEAVEQSLTNLGYTGTTVSKNYLLTNYTDLSGFNTVFLLLGQNSSTTNMGVLGNNSPEESLFVNYLQSGGGLYIEGNDIGWTYDDGSGFTNIWPYFHANYLDDGTGDAGTLNGIAGTFTEGMSFTYSGPQYYIDHFSAAADAWEILENASPAYYTVIAFGDTTYHYNTILSSVPYAALTGTTPNPDTLMQDYYNFLISNTATGISVVKKGKVLKYNLSQNLPNPARNKTTISYSIKKAGHVNISVYNMIGQKVMTVVNEDKKAGIYKTSIDTKKLNSGVYFYKINANDFSMSRKFMVVK